MCPPPADGVPPYLTDLPDIERYSPDQVGVCSRPQLIRCFVELAGRVICYGRSAVRSAVAVPPRQPLESCWIRRRWGPLAAAPGGQCLFVRRPAPPNSPSAMAGITALVSRARQFDRNDRAIGLFRLLGPLFGSSSLQEYGQNPESHPSVRTNSIR